MRVLVATVAALLPTAAPAWRREGEVRRRHRAVTPESGASAVAVQLVVLRR